MTKEKRLSQRLFRKSFISCLALLSVLFFVAPGVSRADTPSNAQITAAIQSQLYHIGIYKHGQVNVQVEDGVATLTGSVESYGAKLHAVRAARHQKGVRSVVDNLQVNTQDIGTPQILQQARHQVLMFPYYTIFDHITLSAKGNRLTVGGEVTEPFKKSDLGNILAGIRGVTYLQNDLQVLPTSFMDDQIREEVAERIYGDPLFANYGNQANPPIHIIVDHGNVTLYGAVNSQVERQQAEIDARFASTYFGLKNHLRIES